MRYRTIMLQLDIHQQAKPAIRLAWDLAQRFDADLIGLSSCNVHNVSVTAVGSFADGELIRREMEDIENRQEELKDIFFDLTGKSEHASWRSEIDDPTHSVLANARSADLIVLSTPQRGLMQDFARSVDPGKVILAAGRPVLFAGDDTADLKGQNVLVAWKDTREARRAIVDAIPFLSHAREVLVATLPEGGPEETNDSLADVGQFLMKHGIKARSEVLSPTSASVGETLRNAASRMGADLIVCGGYGHSRLREWTFGGATRSLLYDGSIHRLMSN